MLKVLLLSGSPRIQGNTMQVLQECARVLEGAGLTVEVVSLAGKRIESCTACYQCGERGCCVIDDGLNEIIEKIRESRGFIVGTPVYFGGPRGDVLAALQRIGMVSRSSDRFLTGMVGGPIAVARRGGHTISLLEMLMFYLINDMVVPGSTYWNMVFGHQPGDALADEEGIKTIRHFAENVANLLTRLG